MATPLSVQEKTLQIQIMKARSAIWITWTAALVSIAVGVLVGQEVVWKLTEFANRFEGAISRKDARLDLRLIGLHRSISLVPKNSILTVGFFLPVGAPTKDVSVEASELTDFHSYFMRAKPTQWEAGARNTFGPWPTMDIIDPNRIDPDNIGILVSYVKSGEKVYLPVDLLIDQRFSPKVSSYRLHFETGREVQTLRVVLAHEDTTVRDVRSTRTDSSQRVKQLPLIAYETLLQCNRMTNPRCVLFAAGSNQAIDIPTADFPSGQYRVLLDATSPGVQGHFSLDFLIYHENKT